MNYATFKDIAADIPRFINLVDNIRRLHSALGYLSPVQFGGSTRPELQPYPVNPEGRTPPWRSKSDAW
jgi:hypothetical protein